MSLFGSYTVNFPKKTKPLVPIFVMNEFVGSVKHSRIRRIRMKQCKASAHASGSLTLRMFQNYSNKHTARPLLVIGTPLSGNNLWRYWFRNSLISFRAVVIPDSMAPSLRTPRLPRAHSAPANHIRFPVSLQLAPPSQHLPARIVPQACPDHLSPTHS